MMNGGVYQHQGSGRKGVQKSGFREKWVKKIRDQGAWFSMWDQGDGVCKKD